MRHLLCWLFGHKPSKMRGGVEGYWYWACPRCGAWMGTGASPVTRGHPARHKNRRLELEARNSGCERPLGVDRPQLKSKRKVSSTRN